jgi:hypothetical protein
VTLKSQVLIGVAIALLSGGGVWWHERDAKLIAEGRAQVERERADSIQVIADARRVESERRQVTSDSLAAELDSTRAASEREVARARAARPEIVERIVHATDTAAIRAAVGELEAEHERETAALWLRIESLEGAYAGERERSAGLEAEVVDLRAVIAGLRAGERPERGFLETWVGRLLYVGVGAGVGWLAAR